MLGDFNTNINNSRNKKASLETELEPAHLETSDPWCGSISLYRNRLSRMAEQRRLSNPQYQKDILQCVVVGCPLVKKQKYRGVVNCEHLPL